eukprot:GILK01003928.1.p1 GENE.GILK01003928.1~~GILK01003928.1.p1  ORF type:complete len:266 (-),score=45.06 GILK01003928.1:310-1107(-)
MSKLWQKIVAKTARSPSRLFKLSARDKEFFGSQPGAFGHTEYTAFKFQKQEDLKEWKLYSDKDIGGKSVCQLDLTPEGKARFSGEIKFTPEQKVLAKSGYAGIKCVKKEYEETDFQMWNAVSIRVKPNDTRYYLISFEPNTEYSCLGDLFQGYFRSSKPNEWVELELPYFNFILTNGGRRYEFPRMFDSGQLKGFVVTADGKTEGKFSLEIDWIKCLWREMYSFDSDSPQNRGPQDPLFKPLDRNTVQQQDSLQYFDKNTFSPEK